MTFDISLLLRLFEGLKRLGPGSEEATRKALAMLHPLPDHPYILNIGCGTGAQARVLATLPGARQTAIDIYLPFLRQAYADGDSATLWVAGSMDALPALPKSADLIWSEGAIFILGFEAGLNSWVPFLKDDGQMVVSDLVWHRQGPRPGEVEAFVEEECPDLPTEDEVISIIRNAGLVLRDRFRLPAENWLKNFYDPLEDRMEAFREEMGDKPGVEELLERTRREIEIFRAYPDWYGYTFFIMER